MRYHSIVIGLLLVAGCDAGDAPAAAKTTPAPSSSSATLAATSATSGTLATGTAPPTPASAAAPPAAPKADPGRLVLKGKAVQGGLVFAQIDGKVMKVEFPGHRAAVLADGKLPIAFYLNAPKSEKMEIQFADGSVLEHVFTVEPRTFETEKIDGLPENVVRLDPKAKKAHDEVEARLDAVRMKASDKTCFEEAFVWPTVGKITSRYGQPRVLNGTDGGIHWGVDIAVPKGTPVKAPACGTVVFAEAGDPLAGTTLVLDHGHGVTSTFIHLEDFKKKVGDEVKQGDVIATSGNTGRATGAHLDWRMSYLEIRVDPELLAGPMPAK